MRVAFCAMFLCACAAAEASAGAGGAGGGGAVAEPADAAPDAVEAGADAGVYAPPGNLCGTPADAPLCTACGADGLGYVWDGRCFYSCMFEDHTCDTPAPSDAWCSPMCTGPQYLPLRSCVPCTP